MKNITREALNEKGGGGLPSLSTCDKLLFFRLTATTNSMFEITLYIRAEWKGKNVSLGLYTKSSSVLNDQG